MLIDRNEMIAPRDVSASYGTYKKNSELEDVPTARPGSNPLSIANDYAAAATFQHPFRWKIANIPQGPLLIGVKTGVKKKTFGQDLGVMKNFKAMIESFSSPDNGKKTFATESKLLEKLKEAMDELNLSANEKKIFTEDSDLLKELKETIERVNSLELPFADIREPQEKFSTPPQSDLTTGLLEFLEKRKTDEEQSAMQATDEGSADNTSNIPPQFGLAEGLLGFLEEQSTMQAMDEGSTGNTNNTSDSGDSADYNLLNVEA